MPKTIEVKGETTSVTTQNEQKSEFERLLEESLTFKFEQGDIVPGWSYASERDGILVDVAVSLKDSCQSKKSPTCRLIRLKT